MTTRGLSWTDMERSLLRQSLTTVGLVSWTGPTTDFRTGSPRSPTESRAKDSTQVFLTIKSMRSVLPAGHQSICPATPTVPHAVRSRLRPHSPALGCHVLCQWSSSECSDTTGKLRGSLGASVSGHDEGGAKLFVIFGWGFTTNHVFGAVFPLLCPNCHNEQFWVLKRIRRWFTLFFIPIFPYESNHVLQCPICGVGREMSGIELKRAKLFAETNGAYQTGTLGEEDFSARLELISGASDAAD